MSVVVGGSSRQVGGVARQRRGTYPLCSVISTPHTLLPQALRTRWRARYSK